MAVELLAGQSSPSQHDPGSSTAVYNFWKEFSLETFRHKLDEQGMSIAENQEQSVKSRKRLAETTREVKREVSSEVLKEVGPLMKQYQEEVDKLSNRAKFGEQAFLDIYQKLYEAPDPAPMLSLGLEVGARAAEMEAAATKMAGELAEYKAESKELRNQEHTIRRLEDRARSLEAQLEDKERQLKEAQAASRDRAEAVAAEMDAMRENALAAALAEARHSLAALQRQHEAGQRSLAELQARSEEENLGLQTQLEIAGSEVERAHARLAALELEKERKNTQVTEQRAAKQPEASTSVSNVALQTMQTDLQHQREREARLSAELASLHQRLEAEEASCSARCDALRQSLQKQEAHSAALEAQLASRPTSQQVEDLQQKVRVLQAVGYGTMEAEEGSDTGATASLEAALLAKARRLEHELTMTRLRVAELSGELEAAGTKLSEAEAELASKHALIQSLEEDLLAAQKGTGTTGNGKLPNGTHATEAAALLSEDASAEEDSGQQTMVRVICSQRDRLKERVNQLGDELSKVGTQLRQAVSSLESAKADNLALVERLRYVQGYRAQTRGREVGPGDVESRYTKEYEEQLNPFTDFQDKERSARRRQLSPTDRLLYEVGQMVSGSRAMRMFVIIYSLALHALVFWVMARWSHNHAHNTQMGAAELALMCQRMSDTLPGQHLHSRLLR
ncbi:g9892 [Coccomyxa viridis]|uniref:Protein CASP n=1 Tax=Coccomyxa viridis TaxID=1274662 RepID=A0ABP1G5E7_9CHLO